MKSEKKLTKSSDKYLSGVLGGIADYMEVDPTIVRIVFVLMMLLTGIFPGTVIYLILVIIMPKGNS